MEGGPSSLLMGRCGYPRAARRSAVLRARRLGDQGAVRDQHRKVEDDFAVDHEVALLAGGGHGVAGFQDLLEGRGFTFDFDFPFALTAAEYCEFELHCLLLCCVTCVCTR